MNEFDEVNLPDEKELVAYIRKQAATKYGAEHLADLSDDDIIYIIDIAYEYYDAEGHLDVELDDEKEIEVDMNRLMDYILKALLRDQKEDPENAISINAEQIEAVVLLESDYIDHLATLEAEE